MIMRNISIIVAVANDGAIGYNGGLLTHLKGDLPRFKSLTLNKTIVMGRKTFDSLPNGALKDRRNIVISRDLNLKLDGCEVIHSIDELSNIVDINEEIFIIGGSEIYSLFFPIVNKLYITRIYKDFIEADTYFKEFSGPYSDFKIVDCIENNDNAFRCLFVTLVRK